jgi:mono/diheme cytochrome c family protein
MNSALFGVNMVMRGNTYCGTRAVRKLFCQVLALLVPVGLYGAAAVGSASPHEPQAQVQRGAASFAKLCSRCHSNDLAGGQGPPLKGDAFAAQWVGKPARALYSRILLTMPLDNPGTLNSRQVMDLAAFIVSVNSFQPVASAFTSPAQMGKITLQARP